MPSYLPRQTGQINARVLLPERGGVRFDPTVTCDEMVSALTREADFDLASAHWVAMRTLGEPDASPFGSPSVPVTTAAQWLGGTGQEALRPWRSYAAVLLALS